MPVTDRTLLHLLLRSKPEQSKATNHNKIHHVMQYYKKAMHLLLRSKPNQSNASKHNVMQQTHLNALCDTSCDGIVQKAMQFRSKAKLSNAKTM